MAPRVFVISPRFQHLDVDQSGGRIRPRPAEHEGYSHLVMTPAGEGEPPDIVYERGLPEELDDEQLAGLPALAALSFTDANGLMAKMKDGDTLFVMVKF
jgi:hypothetical protein